MQEELHIIPNFLFWLLMLCFLVELLINLQYKNKITILPFMLKFILDRFMYWDFVKKNKSFPKTLIHLQVEDIFFMIKYLLEYLKNEMAFLLSLNSNLNTLYLIFYKYEFIHLIKRDMFYMIYILSFYQMLNFICYYQALPIYSILNI